VAPGVVGRHELRDEQRWAQDVGFVAERGVIIASVEARVV
jgi:hypothetical protein